MFHLSEDVNLRAIYTKQDTFFKSLPTFNLSFYWDIVSCKMLQKLCAQ